MGVCGFEMELCDYWVDPVAGDGVSLCLCLGAWEAGCDGGGKRDKERE